MAPRCQTRTEPRGLQRFTTGAGALQAPETGAKNPDTHTPNRWDNCCFFVEKWDIFIIFSFLDFCLAGVSWGFLYLLAYFGRRDGEKTFRCFRLFTGMLPFLAQPHDPNLSFRRLPYFWSVRVTCNMPMNCWICSISMLLLSTFMSRLVVVQWFNWSIGVLHMSIIPHKSCYIDPKASKNEDAWHPHQIKMWTEAVRDVVGQLMGRNLSTVVIWVSDQPAAPCWAKLRCNQPGWHPTETQHVGKWCLGSWSAELFLTILQGFKFVLKNESKSKFHRPFSVHLQKLIYIHT